MPPFESCATSSKIQVAKESLGLQPPVHLATEQVVNPPERKNRQALPTAYLQIKHRRASFRGINPEVSWETSDKLPSSAQPGGHSRCTLPQRPEQCCHPRVAGEGCEGATAAPYPRGEGAPWRDPAQAGPRDPPSDAASPRPAARPTGGWLPGPSTGQSPARLPGPLRSLTVSAVPARGREGAARRPPPSPEYPRSHLQVTPR